ncbi:hypothetical protein [Anaerohalosphaera lusitana]|uniref:hypothetical protein n=1 Tax=Anaerohalosphaera lusitana TaxID=1936003 RepID=UPI00147667CA|nr:hypothetical protein [Anaerohalosphaera lusitana]
MLKQSYDLSHRRLISAVPLPTSTTGMGIAHLLQLYRYELKAISSPKTFGPSAWSNCRPTMPSADFCMSVTSPLGDT